MPPMLRASNVLTIEGMKVHRNVHVHVLLPLGSLALAAAAVVLPAVAEASAPTPSAATSAHAQVIAQSLVEFGDGEHHWQLTNVEPATEATPLAGTGPTFVVAAGDGPSALSSVGTLGWRLEPGEGAFVAAGSASEVTGLVPGASSIAISVESGAGTDGFTPGAGVHDVELVRDVLAPGESLTVSAEISAFVAVSAGAVDVAGTTIPAGVTTAATGDLAIANNSTVPAALVVAVVGPLVEAASSTDSSVPQVTEAPADPPTTNAPTVTTPPPPPTPAPTSPPVTINPTADSDGDGIFDGDEVGVFGTNPNKSDTDGDGYSDYAEVIDFQTNALDADDHP